MSYDPKVHNRRSIRLKDYDYSLPGAYFVTISTLDRKCLFGSVVSGLVNLSQVGRIANETWAELPRHFHNADLDTFIVMPNHVHGIIKITDVRREDISSPTRSRVGTVGQIVGYYKYWTTKLIGTVFKSPSFRLWQRNYYEHVIRNEEDLYLTREYIVNNPLQWELDEENPANI